MALGGLNVPNAEEDLPADVADGVGRLGISEVHDCNSDDGGVQVTCFTEVSDGVSLYFQIIRLHKQQWVDLARFTGLQSTKSEPSSYQTPDSPNHAALECNTPEEANIDIDEQIFLATFKF